MGFGWYRFPMEAVIDQAGRIVLPKPILTPKPISLPKPIPTPIVIPTPQPILTTKKKSG